MPATLRLRARCDFKPEIARPESILTPTMVMQLQEQSG
jgi:hypothetical protein